MRGLRRRGRLELASIGVPRDDLLLGGDEAGVHLASLDLHDADVGVRRDDTLAELHEVDADLLGEYGVAEVLLLLLVLMLVRLERDPLQLGHSLLDAHDLAVEVVERGEKHLPFAWPLAVELVQVVGYLPFTLLDRLEHLLHLVEVRLNGHELRLERAGRDRGRVRDALLALAHDLCQVPLDAKVDRREALDVLRHDHALALDVLDGGAQHACGVGHLSEVRVVDVLLGLQGSQATLHVVLRGLRHDVLGHVWHRWLGLFSTASSWFRGGAELAGDTPARRLAGVALRGLTPRSALARAVGRAELRR